jgi:hypothetical protein
MRFDQRGKREDATHRIRRKPQVFTEQLAARGDLPAGKKAGKAKRPGEL